MSKKAPIKDINEFVEKLDNLKKTNKLDLSSDQDLSIAIMNLVSIEEHFIFSGAKTNDSAYYDLCEQARDMRKWCMEKLVQHPKAEEWCISKHLLAASMRLMEVGTKQQTLGHKKEAAEFFAKAYECYCLFWGINMNLVDTGKIKAIDEESVNKKDKSKNTLFSKLGSVVQKVIDCCIE